MEEWTRAQGELDTRQLIDALTDAGVNPEYIIYSAEYILWVQSELKRLVDEKENLNK